MTSGGAAHDAVQTAGLAGLAALIAQGEVSSVDAVSAALERIDVTQPTLNAFRVVRREAALAEAAEADRRRAAGERLPLLGVPVAMKDEIDIAGLPTAFGGAGDFPAATADCEAVRRVKAAGAVIVGKTNTPEAGQWPFTEGLAFGATRNPWSLDHSPGGSSGGSAAAVAAGLVPAALGSDGAGSIRIPAAWSHLVGIKPQRDRVSTLPQETFWYGLAVLGPLARTVGDAALLLDVLANPPGGTGEFAAAAGKPPGKLRIALSKRIPFSLARARLHPHVESGVDHIAESLTGLGHDVIEADPRYGVMGLTFLPRSLAGVHEWYQGVPDQSLLDPRTRHNAKQGALLRGPALRAALTAERLLHRQVGAIFGNVDVVLAPTTALPPTPIGKYDGLSSLDTDKAIVAACPYTWPWNVLGWPGVNVPAGLTPDGLPVGAQLLGPADSEPLLISLAAQLEEKERWHERRPPAA